MKKIYLFISAVLICEACMAQQQTIIKVSSPELLIGTGEPGQKIEISTNNDNLAEDSTEVDKDGNFTFKLPILSVGKNILIWTKSSSGELSKRVAITVNDPYDNLKRLAKEATPPITFASPSVAGKTVNYKATIWNTNFSIPLARFNFTRGESSKLGDILLFSSIGAGFGMSWGELSETRNDQGTLINQEFINTFGIHLGFLFSAGTGEDTKNVFAPTFNFSILDFQIGLGYELGTVVENHNRTFLTLSYAIPIYKLKKGSFWIWKAAKPITSPRQSRLGM